MTVPERLAALRAEMKSEGIDAWLVPTDDFHGSEYVGDYFTCRRFLTGFTGSAGTALIMKESAYLWTDGRYFLQAARQLEGSGVTLMKSGEEGVPSIEEYLEKALGSFDVLGFDGRCVSAAKAAKLFQKLEGKGITIRVCSEDEPLDLTDRIWHERPALPHEKVWEPGLAYMGVSRAEKLEKLRDAMRKEDCSCHILSSLDDIAWLLNLRGGDIEHFPVFLSYLEITLEGAVLYAMEESFDASIREDLKRDGIELRPYDQIYSRLRQIPAGKRVLLDPEHVNETIWTSLQHTQRVRKQNPTLLMKAVKNPVEMRHMQEAHIRDGVAVCRFLFWLKEQMSHYDPAHPVTELSAAEKLHEYRQEQAHFLDESFDTIAAYGPHGAIMHYSATQQTDVPIRPEGFLLVDSGGQYLEGTTDITRTIACGSLTDEQKALYTRVLRGNLNLGAVKFLHGCTGMAFDYLARQPLWEIGMDYNHSTGHGVGYLLNVHEGPNSISYKLMQGRPLPCVLEAGMVTSNEPGVYLEDRFGIRCENMMLCVKDEKNSYGQFLRFETLTMVPWELDAVIPDLLDERERSLLNAYHKKVYEVISPHLQGAEKEWLGEATRAV